MKLHKKRVNKIIKSGKTHCMYDAFLQIYICLPSNVTNWKANNLQAVAIITILCIILHLRFSGQGSSAKQHIVLPFINIICCLSVGYCFTGTTHRIAYPWSWTRVRSSCKFINVSKVVKHMSNFAFYDLRGRCVVYFHLLYVCCIMLT